MAVYPFLSSLRSLLLTCFVMLMTLTIMDSPSMTSPSLLLFARAWTAVDTADKISVEQIKCFKNQASPKTDQMIFRAWRSLGSVDPNVAQNWKNAIAAGYSQSEISVYMFPCLKGSCPVSGMENQYNALLQHLDKNGMTPRRIWLDVEGANYWTGSKTTNRQQLQRLFNAAVASKRDVGVYSSYYQWEDLFGLDFKLASNVTAAMPMWYAHYDKSPSCGDFKAFGGWAKPTLKQYNGDILGCNGVDHDISYLC